MRPSKRAKRASPKSGRSAPPADAASCRLEALVPVRRLVIVELQFRLRLQRDEEVEGEAAVRRLREREDGAPVVEVTLQRDDLARELVLHEVVLRLPRRRPVLGQVEAQVAAERRRGRRDVDGRARQLPT